MEESTLAARSFDRLLPQDKFVRDNIGREDHLIVSVGGNDIALRPSACTIANILPLIHCASPAMLERACACTPDLYRCCGDISCQGLQGCAAGSCCGCPPGLGYMVDLFGSRVRNYVLRLLGSQRPRTVVIAMIYYPDMARSGSWADAALGFLGYEERPQQLQLAIRTVFELATKRISIPGTRVVPFPMFELLDGSDSRDYVQRVEPSPAGGRKLARALVDAIIHSEAPPAPLGAIMR